MIIYDHPSVNYAPFTTRTKSSRVESLPEGRKGGKTVAPTKPPLAATALMVSSGWLRG